jgi:8-oxo-dGTP diphosphatase
MGILSRIWRRLSNPLFLTELDPYGPDGGVTPPSGRATVDPGVGTSAIIVRNGRILLGLRRGSHAAGLWATPGGHLEFGDSFEKGVSDEVFQETGLIVTAVRKFDFANNILPAAGKHYVTMYFICEVQPGEPQLREPDKCERWEWFGLDALPANIWQGMDKILAPLAVRS